MYCTGRKGKMQDRKNRTNETCNCKTMGSSSNQNKVKSYKDKNNEERQEKRNNEGNNRE